MTDRTRFAALAAAYGGDIARWPATERAAARRMARERWAARILADADALDAWLDHAPPPVPAPALAARILAAAPATAAAALAPARAPVLRARRGRRWAAAFGLAGLTGLCAGAAAMAAALTPADPGQPRAEPDTIFGDIAPAGDD